MKTFLDKLLEYYNITKKQFDLLLNEDNNLPSFLNFKKIDEASLYLKDKIKNNAKILIYGDYDCDGIMATSIMYLALEKIGIKPGFYIPFREKDGYGLTIENINRFHELKYDLIILVDNGITLVDEIDYLNKIGMEALIIDHHTPKDVLPNAKHIIHPTVSNFGDINMSAGAVSFYFSEALLGYTDPYLLTLASISILSDAMPMIDYNKKLVKEGLIYINEYKFPNLCLLLEKNENINENDLSMTLVPKVNAVGRLINDNNLFNIVRYFITKDLIKIKALTFWINSVNEKRKELVKEISANFIVESDDPMVIEVMDINEGLTGLIANKILNEQNKAALILIEESDDKNILKGSIRTKDGFDIIDAFNNIKDLLLSYGGHKNAGGIRFKKENLETIKQKLFKYAVDHPFIETERKYINIGLNEVTNENYKLLRVFAPFGQDNPVPIFELSNFYTKELVFSRDRKHIITPLGVNSSLIYFNFDNNLLNYNFVNFVGTFEDNYFKSVHKVQFKVISYYKN